MNCLEIEGDDVKLGVNLEIGSKIEKNKKKMKLSTMGEARERGEILKKELELIVRKIVESREWNGTMKEKMEGEET